MCTIETNLCLNFKITSILAYFTTVSWSEFIFFKFNIFCRTFFPALACIECHIIVRITFETSEFICWIYFFAMFKFTFILMSTWLKNSSTIITIKRSTNNSINFPTSLAISKVLVWIYNCTALNAASWIRYIVELIIGAKYSTNTMFFICIVYIRITRTCAHPCICYKIIISETSFTWWVCFICINSTIIFDAVTIII